MEPGYQQNRLIKSMAGDYLVTQGARVSAAPVDEIHSCRLSGDTRSQVFSSNNTCMNVVIPGYSGFSTKPLPELMLDYFELDPWDHSLMKFCLKNKICHSRKYIGEWLQNDGHFVEASLFLHIEAETKWLPFHRRHFQIYFLQWNWLNLD